MDYKEIYNRRLVTADEAVQHIHSNNRVVIGHCVGEPSHVVDAMVQNREQYRNVEIIHMLPMGKSDYAKAGMEPYFHHNAFFVGGVTRNTIRVGHGDYIPCYFSEVPGVFEEKLPVDAALIMVTPPDSHGFCSFGVSVDYTKSAAEHAAIVIAQVNKHMPRTLGDNLIHVRDIDYFIEYDEPMKELKPPVITEVEKEIGNHCSTLIKDGDCLQLGIGAVPDAVLLFLKDKKNLGIHSEMFSDGVVELVEAGVINNSMKNINNGKLIATFLMGTQRLYDFVDDNPMVNMHPASYVNNPIIAGSNDNLVSINSCVQVDFLGQVCSEMVGDMQISGVGGQVDFVRAATFSKGGRSIIAMPSTAAGGTISKIVPNLEQGAAVTTNRNDVQYVVTEYGIAELKYKTVRERAKQLIQIAHPDFRDGLQEAFEKRFYKS